MNENLLKNVFNPIVTVKLKKELEVQIWILNTCVVHDSKKKLGGIISPIYCYNM
jgi:hypothetical protein